MWFLKHGSSFVSIASRRESLHPRSPTRVHSAVASSACGEMQEEEEEAEVEGGEEEAPHSGSLAAAASG
jgi:hypothetical protein